MFDVSVSYSDARALCLSLNSHLALPKDRATNDFVIQLRNSVNQGRDSWIGLKYGVDEGTFVWEDGEVLGSFDDWGQGEPNGITSSYCVFIRKATAPSDPDRWTDKLCIYQKGVICEKDPFCPVGYTSFAEFCYKVFTEEKASYTDAQAHCNSKGGHLAMPKDQATNQLLVDLIVQASQVPPAPVYYFFGLTFAEEKNAFIWDDGSDLVGVSNWGAAEAVTNLLVDTVSENCIGISWTAPASQVDNYEVAFFNAEMEVARQNVAGSVKTYEQCSLNPGYPYTFEVASTRNGIRGSAVQISSVTYPTNPTDVTTTNVKENSVTITWGHACCNVETYYIKLPNGEVDNVTDTNIAEGKTAFQSSTNHVFAANRAVDGIVSTVMGAGSCTHTQEESDPSWWVDLGQSYTVDRVVIVNRQDCCWGRINPFNIHIGESDQVSTNPKCGGDHVAAQVFVTILCPAMQGRYVGIRLPGSARTLQVCEFQVFSAPGLSYVMDGLVPGAEYTAVLYSSVNISGEVVLSTGLNVTVATPPGKPQGLQIVSQNRSLHVTWAAPSGKVAIYGLTLTTVADGMEETSTNTTLTSFTFQNLVPGRLYNITVYSSNHFVFSEPVSSTGRVVPAAPPSVNPSHVTSSKIPVSWIASEGYVDSYNITVVPLKSDCGDSITISVGQNRISATVTGLVPGCAFNVSMVAIAGNMESEPVYVLYVIYTSELDLRTLVA
ncbi:fibronectin-like [Branchiostoma floridae x Branchiostoma japonicum]